MIHAGCVGMPPNVQVLANKNHQTSETFVSVEEPSPLTHKLAFQTPAVGYHRDAEIDVPSVALPLKSAGVGQNIATPATPSAFLGSSSLS